MARNETTEESRQRFAADLEHAYGDEDDPLVRIVRPVIPATSFDVAKRRRLAFGLMKIASATPPRVPGMWPASGVPEAVARVVS